MKESIIEIIKRHECWLSLPFFPTTYYPSEIKWREEVENKIKELKKITNGTNSNRV